MEGFDEATMPYRVPAAASVSGRKQHETLLQSIERLRQLRNTNYRGINRGEYTTRHYCVWCAYASEPFICSQFCHDGAGAKTFMEANSELWETMSKYLSEIFLSV